MVLDKVRIQNIKSIKDTGFVHVLNNNPITILAGQNESGKTSFLKALRYFEEGNYEDFEEDDMRLDGVPRVDCIFKLTDSELEELENRTNKDIKNYIRNNGFGFTRYLQSDAHDIRWMNPEEFRNIVSKYNTDIKKYNEELEEEGEHKDEFLPFDYFNSLRPKMVFYSSFLENNLPHVVKKTDLSTNQALIDFQTVYDINFVDLIDPAVSDQKRRTEEKRVNRIAADSLNTYWKQKISNEEADYKYDITINYQSANPETSTINFFVSQGEDTQLKISQKSHGFQWFTGFNLRLRAHEKELDKAGIILLIDEPGQGLHEVAQQDVKEVIEELATKNENIHIIYTTHQPVLLGGNNIDFSRILLVDKTIEKGTQFLSIAAMIGKKGNKDALSPLRSAMGMVSISNPLDRDSAIVLEGITEYYILKSIFKDIDFNMIPSAGADHVPGVVSILYGWGIQTKVLLDGDRKGKTIAGKIKKGFFNDENSEEFERTVLNIDGDGIEELLSEALITEVMNDFEIEYDQRRTKIENVTEIGKFIFARKLYDLYCVENKNVDDETQHNFSNVRAFLADE